MTSVLDDVTVETIRLSPINLDIANHFARRLRDDENFTHFCHTLPVDMLSDRWEVYMTLYGPECVSWGQIEKFPYNPRKLHVCRVGFAVLKEFRGQGFGAAMVDMIMEKTAPFAKVSATTFSDNFAMLKLFLERGFAVEGCFHEEEMHKGKYRSVLSLAKYQKGSL